MRLASFSVGSGSATGLCTIVQLGANAGGLRANVVRWLGQLGIDEPPAADLQAFLEQQQQVDTRGGLKGIVVDLSPLVPGGDEAQSMLASQVSSASATLFVKLTATKAVLAAEKDRFVGLCMSMAEGSP